MAKRFKFYIQSPSFGLLQLKYAPVNWNKSGYAYTRNRFYWGVTRKYMFNSLQFPKDGMQRLIDIKEAGGSESEAQLLVYERDNADYDFKEVYVGDFDFSTYRKRATWVEITSNDSSFEEKFKNRENLKVSLTSRLSMENLLLPSFTSPTQQIILPSRIDNARDIYETDQAQTFIVNHCVPFLLTATEGGNGHSVSDYLDLVTIAGSVFTADVVMDINISGLVIVPISPSAATSIQVRRYDTGGSLQETQTFNSSSILLINITIDADMTLAIGDYINIVMLLNGTSTHTNYGGSLTILSTINTYAKVQVTGVLMYEAWSKLLQVITDTSNPFYSELYGRTDSEPTAYGSDGAESLAIVTNGNMLRGFDIGNRPVSESARRLFKGGKARANTGLGFETIGGVKKVRIETIDHFFGDEVILAFSNATAYSESFAQDFIFNEIKAGYNKVAYEAREGETEYNNESKFGTPIRTVKNILDLISDLRSDNAGITECRKLPFSLFPTTDSKYDKDNFMVDLVREANSITNGGFDNWTANVPDDWSIDAGVTLAEVTVLGDTRCQFTTGNTGLLFQTQSALAGDILQFKLNYTIISSQPNQHQVRVLIKLVGSGTYYLQQDGSWSVLLTSIVIDFMLARKLEDIENFELWSLLADALPVDGDITFNIADTDIAGLTVDNAIISEGSFTARTDEDFTTIENTVNDEKSFNLRWTPARMVHANGMWIRAFLENHLNKEIVFNSSEKNSTVVTRLDTESADIVENENILINNLNTPYWLPEVCECTVVVDTDTIETLDGVAPVNGELAIYQIIKVRKTTNDEFFFGYILDIKVKTKRSNSEADLLLLKVSEYVNIVDNL